MNQKISAQIEAWRKAPLSGEYACVSVDGMWLKRSGGGEVRNVAVLITVGVNAEGCRVVLAVAEGSKEDEENWVKFLREMKERGLKGVKLFVSDKCLGLIETLADFYAEAHWPRCVVHWYRNVWTEVPTGKVKEVAVMRKAIHAQEDLEAARGKAVAVVAKRREMKLRQAAETVENGVEETLSYLNFPREHWRNLRTNNPLERVIRESRRRTRGSPTHQPPYSLPPPRWWDRSPTATAR